MNRKEKFNKDFIINYLDMKHSFDIRILSISFIVAVNFLGMVCLGMALDMYKMNLYTGRLSYLLYIFLVISIWGIIIALFPLRMKFAFFLYSGVTSFVITLSLIVSYIIIVCKVYNFPPAIFASIGILVPLIVLILRIIYRRKILIKRKNIKRGKPLYGIIAVCSLLGLGIGKILFPNFSNKTEDIFFAFLLILLACIFATLIELIDRYFLSLTYRKELK